MHHKGRILCWCSHKEERKHACRKDAILDALELEKQQVERRKESTCLEVVSSNEKEYDTLAKKSKNGVLIITMIRVSMLLIIAFTVNF